MNDAIPGTHVATINGVKAFLPDSIPRSVSYSPTMVGALGAAADQLGGLRALSSTSMIASLQGLLIGPLLRREATASSRIEGTQTDFGQLLLFEATEERSDPAGDAHEVWNYVQALAYGLNRPPDRRITLQLIREMHAMLLQDARGADMRPGEFRTVQNWIGGGGGIERARYVPPPPEHVLPLLEDLVAFISDPPDAIPPLIRIAMAHYQFEAIHPFLDGNGRLGRLLVVMLLVEWSVLHGPFLSLSEVLEERRQDYIDGLRLVSMEGAWDSWIEFFLSSMSDQAERDQRRIEQLMQLRERWRARYQSGRSIVLLHLVDFVFERPVFSASQAAERLDYTYRAIQNAINQMIADGLLREMTGQRRNRVYASDEVLAIVTPS